MNHLDPVDMARGVIVLRCVADFIGARERPCGPVPRVLQGEGPSSDAPRLRGRRVLVSRKWSGKTMADHKTERRAEGARTHR
jgi:hypothetical protein